MKKAWLFLADRFDARQPRERLLVFLGVAALLITLFYLLILSPDLQRYQQARNAAKQSEIQLAALNQQELMLVQASLQNPDAETLEQIKQAAGENQRLRAELADGQTQFVPPEKMDAVLRDLIASQKGLELVSIRSGKAENLLEPSAGASVPATNEQGIFRHGMELTVRGDYATLAAYMKKVEALPSRVYLSDLSLKVDRYPVSTMKLKLYTLSLERAWLGF